MLGYQKSSPALSPAPKSASDVASLVYFRAYVCCYDYLKRCVHGVWRLTISGTPA